MQLHFIQTVSGSLFRKLKTDKDATSRMVSSGRRRVNMVCRCCWRSPEKQQDVRSITTGLITWHILTERSANVRAGLLS